MFDLTAQIICMMMIIVQFQFVEHTKNQVLVQIWTRKVYNLE